MVCVGIDFKQSFVNGWLNSFENITYHNIIEVASLNGELESFVDCYKIRTRSFGNIFNSAVPHPDVQERSPNKTTYFSIPIKTKERGVLEIQLSAVLDIGSFYMQITDSSTS